MMLSKRNLIALVYRVYDPLGLSALAMMQIKKA